MTETVLVVLLCAAGCGVGGLAAPLVVRRLPEPLPKPEDELSDAERAEGRKQRYDVLAARGGFASSAAGWSAAAGAVIGLSVGWSWLLVGLLPLVPVLVALALIDLRTRLLPAVVVRTAHLALIVLAGVGALVAGDSSDLVRALVAMAIGRSVFWLLWFIHSAGMGFGDVRLAALLSFVLGYVGWSEFAVGMYAGFLVFGLPGLLLALVRRDRSLLKAAYPFGPFMIAGALLGLCLGGPIADALLTGR